MLAALTFSPPSFQFTTELEIHEEELKVGQHRQVVRAQRQGQREPTVVRRAGMLEVLIFVMACDLWFVLFVGAVYWHCIWWSQCAYCGRQGTSARQLQMKQCVAVAPV